MKIRLLIILIVPLQILSSCKEKPEFSNFTGFTQGTTYSIVYDNRNNINPDNLKLKVEKIFHDFTKIKNF